MAVSRQKKAQETYRANLLKEGAACAFDAVEAYLVGVRDHASRRIHNDNTALDVRQTARCETAMRAIEWVRAARNESARS